MEWRVADFKVDSKRWVGSTMKFARDIEWVLRVEAKLVKRDQSSCGLGQKGEDSRLKTVLENVLVGILVVYIYRFPAGAKDIYHVSGKDFYQCAANLHLGHE